MSQKTGNEIRGREKKTRQAIHITPLRPVTLAAFPPWGSSPGAGCMGLALSGQNYDKLAKPKNFPSFFKQAFWLYLLAFKLNQP